MRIWNSDLIHISIHIICVYVHHIPTSFGLRIIGQKYLVPLPLKKKQLDEPPVNRPTAHFPEG